MNTTKDETLHVLKDHLHSLNEAVKWLKRSYNQCEELKAVTQLSEDDFDKLETLTSRFARVIDFLIYKVFRSIDAHELEDGGTILDIVNRAHKRNLFESVDEIRMMKDLRNDIAHEYDTDSLQEIFAETLAYTPLLIQLVEKTHTYCEKYFN